MSEPKPATAGDVVFFWFLTVVILATYHFIQSARIERICDAIPACTPTEEPGK